MIDSLKDYEIQANEEVSDARLKERLSELDEEKAAMLKSLKSGEMSYKDYSDKIMDVSKQRQSAEEESAKEHGKKISEITAVMLRSISQTAMLSASMIEDVFSSSVEVFDTLREAGHDLDSAFAGVFEDIAKNGEKMGAAMALSFGGYLAQMASDGELTGKEIGDAFLASLIDMAQKAIATYAATIFGAATSMLGPIAGPITAGVLIATMQGMLAMAKAKIGAEEGVIDINGSYSKKAGATDTIPLWVAKGESVITAKATAANRDILEYINKTGRSAEEYLLTTDITVSKHILTEMSKRGLNIAAPAPVSVVLSEGNHIVRQLESANYELRMLRMENKQLKTNITNYNSYIQRNPQAAYVPADLSLTDRG